MRILFIHNNQPGQFKYLISALLNKGHDVTFLSSFRGTPNPKIKQYWAKKPTEKSEEAASYFQIVLEQLARKRTFDLIISHSGFFCGTYAKYFFPNTPLIAYLEWWFSSDQSQKIIPTPFINHTDDIYSALYLRNKTTSLELAEADAIVCPTDWQARFLPSFFKSKLHVIFDGVPDHGIVNQSFAPPAQGYVSYSSRGLEPIRCFPEFIQSIPYLRRLGVDLPILILGADKIHYGCGSPDKVIKSFRKWGIKYLEKNRAITNVHFLGKLKYNSYLSVLKKTDLHVHLTQPFVPSWSLFDAISLGTNVLAGDNESTNDIISISSNVQATSNTFSPLALAQDIKKALPEYNLADTVSTHSGPLSLESEFFNTYGLDSCLKKWFQLIDRLTK